MGNADLALVKAKAVGRGRISVFAPNLRLEAVARRLYGMELHRAVAKGEFQLFYQPQINLATGALTGAEALELEITENIVLNSDDTVLETLQRLRAQGVGISFDDFGTGYASLSLLKTHPITRIKIDRSFVSGILESNQDATVVRAILDVARSFDLNTIAEGIETDAQRERLQAEHCEEGQGYLFGKPMAAQQFAQTFGIETALRIMA